LEEDPVWSSAGSQDFVDKYINHSFPAVASLAGVTLEVYHTRQEKVQLEEKLRVLLEDKRHNTLLPAELYRLIQTSREDVESKCVRLETELQVVRAEVVDLRTQDSVSRALLSKLQGLVDNLLALEHNKYNQISLDESAFRFSSTATTIWKPESECLTYSGEGHNYAIGNIKLSTTCCSKWRVTVQNLASGGWLYIGINGILDQPLATPSFGFTAPPVYGSATSESHLKSSSFGWAGTGEVFVRGTNNTSLGSWDGWTQGDVAVLTYSPICQQLSMERAGVTYAMGTGVLPEAYMHFNLRSKGTTLLIVDDSPVIANIRK
jgi:hypothetical protein